MKGLASKVAVVTGASKGIGAETARLLASEGVKVVVNYRRSADDAEAVVDSIESEGGVACAVQADVSKEKDVAGLFDAAIDAYGHLDILVNNAGPIEMTTVGQFTGELINRMLGENFTSVAICAQSAAELFPNAGGVIINVSSETVRNILPGCAVFAAAKSAAETLTRYLAHELGPRHIRVVGVAPGYVRTPATSGLNQETIDHMVSRTAMRRPGEITDLAPVIAFLASEDGAWNTGTTLTVSGGLSL